MAKKAARKPDEYRDFILGVRNQINLRVNQALGRFPNYRIEAVKVGFEQCFRNLFEANKKTPQPNFGDVFDAQLNLFLLAVGQNYYTGSGTPIRQPHLDPLFNIVFPKCLPLLCTNPYSVPAMLFNACEYVGDRAGKFLEAFTRVLPLVDLANLENVIQFLLWWLGDPRRRQFALTVLEGLPEKARTEIFNLLFDTSCESEHILASIGAMKDDPFINPAEYIRSCGKNPPTKIAGKTKGKNPDNTCRFRYGSFTGFSGIYDAPPKIAGYQAGYVITYTPTGKLYYSMLDGIGSWEKRVPIPPCTKVVHPTEDSCFGITTEGTLMNLRSGEQIFLGDVRECVNLFADKQYLFVVVKSNKSLDAVLKFHLDWAKNPTQKTRKTKKNLTDPITFVPLPAQPYHLCPDPNQPDALLFEVYNKESMDYQLVRATVNHESGITHSSVLYEQKESYLFSMQGNVCHILHADGSYAWYNPECTKADLTLKFHGLTRPTSFLVNDKNIFATSDHSFHLFGFLLRPAESGVPTEINLISRS